MQYLNFLGYRNYRYLKLAGVLVGFFLLSYWAISPFGGTSYGGTWFGYLLGSVSLVMVLLLAWYGVRRRRTPMMPDRRRADRRRMMLTVGADQPKRRGRDRRLPGTDRSWRNGGTLRGWLSAHVYLGAVLLVTVSLHSGFRFGWNVHTLAYLLVLVVLVSGIYGVFAYVRYPRLITENIGGDTLHSLQLRISELDEMARIRALGLPDKVNALVSMARTETRLGGNLFQQLSATRHYCPTAVALRELQLLGQELVSGDQPQLMRDLHFVLLQKQQLVRKARNDIYLNARMRSWLYLHTPLSVALLAAIVAHVLTIFLYW
jgi:hypothetical protein